DLLEPARAIGQPFTPELGGALAEVDARRGGQRFVVERLAVGGRGQRRLAARHRDLLELGPHRRVGRRSLGGQQRGAQRGVVRCALGARRRNFDASRAQWRGSDRNALRGWGGKTLLDLVSFTTVGHTPSFRLGGPPKIGWEGANL